MKTSKGIGYISGRLCIGLLLHRRFYNLLHISEYAECKLKSSSSKMVHKKAIKSDQNLPLTEMSTENTFSFNKQLHL
jgi:hypothetical protein